MAANLNKVLLIGNLTRDPELRYIPSGTAVSTFTVAMNRAYATQSGEKKEEVTFIRVVVWGRRAEACGEYLSKGSPVFVEGRLRTRTWQTPDGQNRSTVEVVANNVQFLRAAARPQQKEIEESRALPEEVGSIDIGNNQSEEWQDRPARNKESNDTKSSDNDEVPF